MKSRLVSCLVTLKSRLGLEAMMSRLGLEAMMSRFGLGTFGSRSSSAADASHLRKLLLASCFTAASMKQCSSSKIH